MAVKKGFLQEAPPISPWNPYGLGVIPRQPLSEDRGQAISIKGALNIFYFLQELCL